MVPGIGSELYLGLFPAVFGRWLSPRDELEVTSDW
jgi:hypothetical protein